MAPVRQGGVKLSPSEMLAIRRASATDAVEIERMVDDFVKGHPAENHPRESNALRAAFFGEHPVAHMLLADVARVCSEASAAGASFVQGGGGDGPSRLYERVAIGMSDTACHLSGKAFQVFAKLDGLPAREIVRRLPAKELGLQPPDEPGSQQ